MTNDSTGGRPYVFAMKETIAMPLRILVIALVLVAFTPAAALACPVCGLAGPGDNGWAYFAMTMMLSVLPLAFIGGVVYWVYRRASAVPPPATDAARQSK